MNIYKAVNKYTGPQTCRARRIPPYVLLLIMLTYMLLIMSRLSFPQAYSLLAIYMSTQLPWRRVSVSDECFRLL